MSKKYVIPTKVSDQPLPIKSSFASQGMETSAHMMQNAPTLKKYIKKADKKGDPLASKQQKQASNCKMRTITRGPRKGKQVMMKQVSVWRQC